MATPTLDEFQRRYDRLAERAGKVLDLTDKTLALDDVQSAALGLIRRDSGALQAALEEANATIDAAVQAARRPRPAAPAAPRSAPTPDLPAPAPDGFRSGTAVRFDAPASAETAEEFTPLVPQPEPAQVPDVGYRTALRRLARRTANLAAAIRRVDERVQESGLRSAPKARIVTHTPLYFEIPTGMLTETVPQVVDTARDAMRDAAHGVVADGVGLVAGGLRSVDARTARLRRIYLGEANRVAGVRHRF